MSLLCFALTLQMISTICLYATQSYSLIAAQRQSTLDLSVLSYVRMIIENNEYIRRCHLSEEDLIESRFEQIDGVDVALTDCDSYILCTYEKQDRYIEMKVYYDGDRICGMDIDSVQKTG